MRKLYVTLILVFAFVLSLAAQGTETFTNIPASSSAYATRDWTGDNGLAWQATDARTDQVITSSNKAICIRNGSVTCNNIPNGVGNLSFKHLQVFTGSGSVLEIRINGNLVGTANPTATVATATINNINITGTFNLEIKQITSGLRIVIDDVTWTAASTSPACTEPIAQPTALNLTPATTSMGGSFSAASPVADGYLVVKSTSSSLSSQPLDGTAYTAGQSLGGGTVITTGSSTNFNASGLTAATTYYYFVYAYNNSSCSGGPNYLITSALTASAATTALPACITPTAAPTALGFTATNTSISGSFTAAASANRYLVVRNSVNSLSAAPVNGTTYTTGQSLGGGIVVSYSSATTFTATGLTKNTTYYFFIFSANAECTGEPYYSTQVYIDSKATTNTNGNLPANYYDAANGLSCSSLKTALAGIISTGSTQLTYTPGVWEAHARTDKRRNDANTADIVWDMYSDNPNGAEPYTFTFVTNQCGNYSKEGDCFNREHSFPSSWFADGYPMYSDINHLFPTDGYVNNIRSNYPFGEVASATTTTQNGSKLGTGNNFSYTGIVFEPIDAYKGDFARAQLYMATRYENAVAGWQNNGTANAVLNGTSYQVFDDWHLQLLYKWHVQDPVSQKEIDRNDSVFVIQGNRNPFIDHPEWVSAVWSCTGLLTTTPVTSITNNASDGFRLYPNPVTQSTTTLQLDRAFTSNSTIQVTDLTGRIISNIVLPAGKTIVTLETVNIRKGMYVLKITNKNSISTKTFVVQ
ncbi:T9SS type A sorting domain-containing protein [Lacibacter luteus]|uniref:T9SS type A sorting domain-containing protein n=1 Tax=Lacibacter luteus TaxID=2508719 RepID=A0A4Q1CDT8_9BACT|nr:endonuclease [Lacibacter luteus]RXK57833.1 T9SS type A sorting domain-containing protein [Lacibacter luteus]